MQLLSRALFCRGLFTVNQTFIQLILQHSFVTLMGSLNEGCIRNKQLTRLSFTILHTVKGRIYSCSGPFQEQQIYVITVPPLPISYFHYEITSRHFIETNV
jgi:hypothetical protein